jgi:hypothetical protein
VPIRDPRPGFQSTQQGYTPVFTVLEIVDGDILPPPAPGITYLYNDGGVLSVGPGGGWPPRSDVAGALYSNGGVCSAVAGAAFAPLSQPLVFGKITAAQLLTYNGGNFPWTPPSMGSGVIWIPGGEDGGDMWVA